MTKAHESTANQRSPWPALWSMMIGFFMILVDSTIVSVAIPAIQHGLDADVNQVIWVNSSYLLAYAVPLLITGRLGDRFGPRNIYLLGLLLFTLSSLWCGLAGSIEMLIVARVFQGLGGALLTPQTMSVMIRIFSPTQRGAAMGVWGGVAGVATIVGPLLGGLLVDAAGWEWIFFVNVPVGIIGIILAWIFVPRLEVTNSRFDVIGVLLSAVGMFCLIFAIQEGDNLGWDWRFWALLIAGLVLLALFVAWQARVGATALVPLSLFKDRNFSLACIAIATVGMSISTFAIPWMIYIQTVKEYTPTDAALLLVPSGIISGVLSPLVGKQTNVHSPKPFAIAGLTITGISFGLIAFITNPDISPLWLLAIAALSGLGNSMMWGPLSMIATRNLPGELAGQVAGGNHGQRAPHHRVAQAGQGSNGEQPQRADVGVGDKCDEPETDAGDGKASDGKRLRRVHIRLLAHQRREHAGDNPGRHEQQRRVRRGVLLDRLDVDHPRDSERGDAHAHRGDGDAREGEVAVLKQRQRHQRRRADAGLPGHEERQQHQPGDEQRPEAPVPT